MGPAVRVEQLRRCLAGYDGALEVVVRIQETDDDDIVGAIQDDGVGIVVATTNPYKGRDLLVIDCFTGDDPFEEEG